MSATISDYAKRSAVLLQATERFEHSADPREREATTKDLLNAADKDSFADVRLGFGMEPETALPETISGRLSGALFDLQTANVLVAAGLRTEVAKEQAQAELLKDAREQMATTREELLLPANVPTDFAARLIRSSTPESATKQFRNYSDQLLEEIVSEAEKTLRIVIIELKNLDPGVVSEAVGQIGEAVPIVASAGHLLRKGLEKLKRAIEALISMFGKETMKKAKTQIEQIVKETGMSSRALLESLLGARSVKARIHTILENSELNIGKVDSATNSLPELAANFNRDNKLLRAVARAIQLAALLLPGLPFAAPWLTPSLAIAYVLTIGASVLICQQYTGAWRVLTWVNGIEQIAERMA